MVIYHGHDALCNEEWDKLLAYYKEVMDGPFEIERLFVFSDGGAPNALQRRKLADILKGKKQPIAYMCTENKFVQRVIRMLSFLGVNKITILNPNEAEEELQSIGLDSYQAKRITTVVELLKKRLEPNNSR